MNKEETHEEKVAKFRKRFSEKYDRRTNIVEIIKHLGLDSENPNIGTKNKQRLMVKALTLLKMWKTCNYDNGINRLSLRLNMTVRTIRENYIDPLISEGILRKTGSQIVFVGIPDEGDQ